VDEYKRVTGSSIPATIIGGPGDAEHLNKALAQAVLETDPQADANVFTPRRKAIEAYVEALDRFHLDGFVYPAAQMPPPDETMPQDGQISGGPHSDTGWLNDIGAPAVVVPGGFYPTAFPSAWKSPRAIGRMATCSAGPTPTSKQPNSAIRPSSWKKACCPSSASRARSPTRSG